MQLTEAIQQSEDGCVFNYFTREMDNVMVRANIQCSEGLYILMLRPEIEGQGPTQEITSTNPAELEMKIKPFRDYNPDNWQVSEY